MAGRKLNPAQRELAERSLPLVREVLRKLGARAQGDLEEDLYSAGCVGLCCAALGWRAGSVPFADYAREGIENEILTALHREQRQHLMAGGGVCTKRGADVAAHPPGSVK